MLQKSEQGLNPRGDLGITLHYLHDLEKVEVDDLWAHCPDEHQTTTQLSFA